jgi:hypothetical protein
MKNIKFIYIESESDVNGFFTISYSDGTIKSGWSCDQGSIESDNDDLFTEEEQELCFNAWFGMDFSEDDKENRLVAVWDPKRGLSKTLLASEV